jgi:hypothetical protein
MIRPLHSLEDGAVYDVVVAGAGAGGLAAALFAALAGGRVLLVEASDHVGGTTAWSAGSVWIPNTHLSPAGSDSPAAARAYLDAVIGNHAPAPMRAAFLASGPAAVARLTRDTAVQLRPYPLHPDYEQTLPGATASGRALAPVPFDGRRLGAALALVRPPIPEFTVLGGMMVDRTDIAHLLGLTRSLGSLRHVAGLLARHAGDRLRGRRASRLVMGNALVGQLLWSLLQRDVDLVTGAAPVELRGAGDSVDGVVLAAADGARRQVAARRAVVLAGGGFSGDASYRARLLPQGGTLPTVTAPGQGGALLDLALAQGARLGSGAADAAYWAPVSRRRRSDGSEAVFPHFVLDRSKPGTLCIDQRGRRFVNEAASYHGFARAMLAADAAVPCWLLADARALRAYGLGMVRIGTRRLAPYLADGYLVEGRSLDDLAARLGVPAEALQASVARFNGFAVTGVDPDFGRGSTLNHCVNGDPAVTPNPTLAPLATPPFYAVRLWPGDIGAATGLVTDTEARVLAGDRPIAGLYAVGNAMQSITGGTYPGPGITLGPALTFAYRAMQHTFGADRASEETGP